MTFHFLKAPCLALGKKKKKKEVNRVNAGVENRKNSLVMSRILFYSIIQMFRLEKLNRVSYTYYTDLWHSRCRRYILQTLFNFLNSSYA